MLDIESITNKIINADCLDAMNYIPDKSIDCIICDLPYGTTACSWDVVIPFDKLWKQYKRIRKDNTPIVLFGSEPFSTYLRMSNIKEYKYDWIWVKNRPTGLFNAKTQPMKYFEIISVFYKDMPIYNPQMWEGIKNHKRGGEYGKSEHFKTLKFNESKDGNLKYPRNVLFFDRPHPPIHPTQKPVALLEYLIKTYSNEGDLILDNCSGSGSLAIAAYNTHRNFICIEKDEKYYNTSIKRLEDAQAQMRLF